MPRIVGGGEGFKTRQKTNKKQARKANKTSGGRKPVRKATQSPKKKGVGGEGRMK